MLGRKRAHSSPPGLAFRNPRSRTRCASNFHGTRNFTSIPVILNEVKDLPGFAPSQSRTCRRRQILHFVQDDWNAGGMTGMLVSGMDNGPPRAIRKL